MLYSNLFNIYLNVYTMCIPMLYTICYIPYLDLL